LLLTGCPPPSPYCFKRNETKTHFQDSKRQRVCFRDWSSWKEEESANILEEERLPSWERERCSFSFFAKWAGGSMAAAGRGWWTGTRPCRNS
jgi:hypothetical protein